MPCNNPPRAPRRKRKPRRKPGLSCTCTACEGRWRRGGGVSETDTEAETEYESDGDGVRAAPLSPKRARYLGDVARRHGLAINETGEPFDPERPQRAVVFDVDPGYGRRKGGAGGEDGGEAAPAASGWVVSPAGRVRAGGAAELLSPLGRRPTGRSSGRETSPRPERPSADAGAASAGAGGGSATGSVVVAKRRRPRVRRSSRSREAALAMFLDEVRGRLDGGSFATFTAALQADSSSAARAGAADRRESVFKRALAALDGHPDLVAGLRGLLPRTSAALP
mmetsp:Transcript_2268/g.7565  ORF Transcript_2268/g.7565 Transcript_2268/m.7565 type:complete len:281 (-) Transcript_2268:966-1808(-)